MYVLRRGDWMDALSRGDWMDTLNRGGCMDKNIIIIIIIIVTSFAPISSKIKLSGATKPGD